MTLMTCAAVRRRLDAFYDRELPVRELIAIEAHLKDCPPCARELREIRSIGDTLRFAVAPGPADDWTGLQSGVISRMRAEEHESWHARVSRTFDDLHLVWIGLASTAATFLCAFTVLSMLHFASPERADSLAGLIDVFGAPTGSNLNPARLDPWIQMPRVSDDGIVYATLENALEQDDRMLAVSTVVTTDGRISGMEALGNDYDPREVEDLVAALSRSRLEPAQFLRSPVAVNMVWVLAHTTVKGRS